VKYAPAEGEFRQPETDTPFNVDAALAALPKQATIRGMFFHNVTEQVPEARRAEVLFDAGLPEAKFRGLVSYPYADFIRLIASAAPHVHPRVPLREAITRVGESFYEVLADSLAGRVIFGVLGRDAERIFGVAAHGWKLSLNFGEVESAKHSPSHFRITFENCPALLDTSNYGVIRGALRFCGVKGRVLLAQENAGTGAYDVTW
jgi:uncharacterized protein (TIGR02265 family)